MFNSLVYNWKIHRLLHRLAKQRVGMVLPPDNIWVIEYAVKRNDETRALLLTCQLRGWVEMLHEAVPSNRLNQNGTLPDGPIFTSKEHIWKLTDSGWAAIQRRHEITILGILVTLIGVIIAVFT